MKNFPVDIKNNLSNYIKDNAYLTNINIPSDSNITKFGNTTGTVATSSNIPVGSIPIPAGKIFMPISIIITAQCEKDIFILAKAASIDTTWQEILASSTEPNCVSENWVAFKSGGEISKTIDVSGWGLLRSSTRVALSYWVSPEGSIATVKTPYVQGTINGYMIDDDVNYSAPNKVLFICDSYAHTNSSDPSTISPNYKSILGKNYFPKVFRDLLILNKSIETQVINKSFGGATTLTACQFLLDGYYDNIDCNSIIISLGFNDAAGTWNTTNRTLLKNRIREFVTWRNTRKKQTPIFFCLPYPAVNTDTTRNAAYLATTKIADIRVAISEVISEFGDANKVYSVDFSDVYLNTDYANYSASSGDNKTHPSSIGHGKLGQRLYDVYVAKLGL